MQQPLRIYRGILCWAFSLRNKTIQNRHTRNRTSSFLTGKKKKVWKLQPVYGNNMLRYQYMLLTKPFTRSESEWNSKDFHRLWPVRSRASLLDVTPTRAQGFQWEMTSSQATSTPGSTSPNWISLIITRIASTSLQSHYNPFWFSLRLGSHLHIHAW